MDTYCPSGDNCCEDHGGMGCENQECQDAVCSLDPTCCNVVWDNICVNIANEVCAPEFNVDETAKASLILGDGPEWLPASCNNIGELCNTDQCGGNAICVAPTDDTGGLGICADINDGAIAVQTCDTNGQDDCDNPESVCIDRAIDFCLSPSLMCPDQS